MEIIALQLEKKYKNGSLTLQFSVADGEDENTVFDNANNYINSKLELLSKEVIEESNTTPKNFDNNDLPETPQEIESFKSWALNKLNNSENKEETTKELQDMIKNVEDSLLNTIKDLETPKENQ